MKLRHFILSLSLAACACAASAGSYLDGGRLIVDGQPFIILGGELGNSSASCAADIRDIFPRLKAMGLNTVLVPAYWDLLEPREGEYDFSLTDTVIDEARANGLRVVFLWFGAWKNSMSCYAPEWFKSDFSRFPRAMTAAGKPLEIASAFSPEVLEADLRAFSAWLGHVVEYDRDGTVIMLQIENEIGMLEDARDHSPLAQAEYDKGVPPALMESLLRRRDELAPELRSRWEANGGRRRGSWAEVFGDDIYSDEYFMAWNYARYVERLAREARGVTMMPLYVNAAMNSRGRVPGEYPSAGPLAHLRDIWRAGAPTVDFLSPDIYDSGFKDWVGRYAVDGNLLFIPEVRREDANGAQALYVVGEHGALGFSPFSIENAPLSSPMSMVYPKLAELTPLVAAHLADGTMSGVYFTGDDTERVIDSDGMRVTARHYFTLPWDPRATDGSPWPAAGGVIIRVAPMEYIVAGTGIVLTFGGDEGAVSAPLGEDGFAESGGAGDAASSSAWGGKSRVGLLSVDEVSVAPDGTLQYVRRDNGDETHQGRHVRIGVDDCRILRVRLYEYR